jgi:hypothetical protein
MALQLGEGWINFPPTTGRRQRLSTTVVFGQQLRAAQAVLIGLLVVSLSALHAQSPTVLDASKAFDINLVKPKEMSSKLTVHAFRAGRTGLYFLVSTSSSNLLGAASIFQTDHQGVYQATVHLAATAEVIDFDVDDTGLISMLVVDKTLSLNGAVLLSYNPDGTLSHTKALAAPASALVITNGTPAILNRGTTGAEILRLNDTSKRMTIPLQRSTAPVQMIALPDQRVLLAERRSAILYFLDFDRGSIVAYAPRVPEMAWLASLPPGNTIGNIAFSSIATTPIGQVVVLLGHYRLSEGAPLLYFHMNGNLVETIRCKLPQFADERSANNPGGEMIPLFVGGGSASSVTLVSASGKVAVYRF